MSEPSIKVREDRARRALAKHHCRLCKTPSRSWLRKYYGVGYQIIDQSNTVRIGYGTREYEATLKDVEDFAFRIPG
jgi:hypothetical protein